jgi:hypothetical protein
MKRNKEQLYKEHLDEMFGATALDDLAESDIDRIVVRLLSFLPNNGRLYKYRSIEGESFEYAYDGLKNGYIYMARANTLNDDLDSTLNFDVEKDLNRQMMLFVDKPWLYLDAWVKANSNVPIFRNANDKDAYQIVMSCVDPKTYELDKNKALRLFSQYGIEPAIVKKYIDEILKLAYNEIHKHSEELKNSLSELVNFNNDSRKDLYVFSMTEDYDSNTMWAYYANSNKGFCIEYDYNKVKNMQLDKKRLLISLYKVIYKKQFEEHSFVDMLQYFIGGKKDKELLKKANMQTISHMITKLDKWKEEKEWRIFLCNLDSNNKIFVDMVSGVILDERITETDNGKKLLSLAHENNWKIRIRKKNRNGTDHYYEDYIEVKNRKNLV